MRVLFALLLFGLSAAGRSQAQAPIEVGVDAGLQIDGNGSDAELRTWSLPVAALRVGLHTSERLAWEVTLGASRVEILDAPDSPVATDLDVGIQGLYHFGSNRESRRFHVLFGVPFRRTSIGDDTGTVSDSEYGIAGGVGLTLPLSSVAALRVQTRGIAWRHTTTRLSFLVGLSAFVR
jgi:hypothetical protein